MCDADQHRDPTVGGKGVIPRTLLRGAEIQADL